MAGGVVVYRMVPGEPDLTITALMVVFLTACGWLARNQPVAGPVFTLVLAFLAGFGLPVLHARLNGTEMISFPGVATITGTVTGVRDTRGDRQVLFLTLGAGQAARWLEDVRVVRLSVRDFPPVAIGSELTVRARLFQVPGPVAPGGYDPQFFDYFAGIGAYASALDPPVVNPPSPGIFQVLEAVRGGLKEKIDRQLPGNTGAVARALIIGDTTGISEADRRKMAVAGLAHVLAISGLHLSIVAGFVFAIVRFGLAATPFGDRMPVKSVAAVAALATAVAYLSISGASIATIRSTIMLSMILGAVIFGRQAFTLRNVAFAGIAIMLLAPTEVLKPGFQLSFAAVIALVGCYESLSERRFDHPRGGWAKVWRYGAGLALTSVIAGVATAPFAAYFFQQFAPLGLVANLLAVPVVGFLVLPAGLLAVIAAPLSLEAPFLAVMGFGIDLILAVAEWISSLTGNLARVPEMSAIWLGGVVVGLAWFAFLRHPVRFAGPLASLLGFVVFAALPAPDVLVSDSTKAVAVRTDEGLRLVRSNRTSFAVRAWSDRYGADLVEQEPAGRCDRFGCVVDGAGGFSVGVARSFGAAAEDCAAFDLMVARVSSPSGCGLVVGPRDLRAGGTHAIYRAGTGDLMVRRAITDLARPWRAGRR